MLALCRVCVCTYARACPTPSARLQLNYVAMAIFRKRSQFMIININRDIAFLRGARDS